MINYLKISHEVVIFGCKFDNEGKFSGWAIYK